MSLYPFTCRVCGRNEDAPSGYSKPDGWESKDDGLICNHCLSAPVEHAVRVMAGLSLGDILDMAKRIAVSEDTLLSISAQCYKEIV